MLELILYLLGAIVAGFLAALAPFFENPKKYYNMKTSKIKNLIWKEYKYETDEGFFDKDINLNKFFSLLLLIMIFFIFRDDLNIQLETLMFCGMSFLLIVLLILHFSKKISLLKICGIILRFLLEIPKHFFAFLLLGISVDINTLLFIVALQGFSYSFIRKGLILFDIILFIVCYSIIGISFTESIFYVILIRMIGFLFFMLPLYIAKNKMLKFPRQKFKFVSFLDIIGQKKEKKVKEKILKNLNCEKSKLYFTKGGRDCVYYIFKALYEKISKERPVKQGRPNVLVPAFNFSLIPKLIEMTGMECIYVDVTKKDYNIDTSKIEEKINENTRAILVTHIFGNPADMDFIKKIKIKYNLFIVEDCAHVFGKEYGSKKLGSIGDASIFSLKPSKPLQCLYGGFIIVNNKKLFSYFSNMKLSKKPCVGLFEELKYLIMNNIQSCLLSKYVYSFFSWYLFLFIERIFDKKILDEVSKDDTTYNPDTVKKLGKINLSILSTRLDKINKINQQRKIISNKLFIHKKNEDVSLLLLPLYVKDKDKAVFYLKQKAIDIKIIYSVNISHSKKSVAQDLQDHLIYLPSYVPMSKNEIKYLKKITSRLRLLRTNIS